ncbi:Transcriptional regulatory protein [Modicella reniformis]|uniref:Transcriptional regulatory protein n=1 Tax=Modicella reniformis TaxID=1440133 RepID=A0A9P6MI11_9FUNG|nr:Transcriptional regulatory protein [Modicella reniformis]
MKSNGKDKAPVSANEQQSSVHDEQDKKQGTLKSDTILSSSIHDKETDKEQTPNLNGKDESIGAPEPTHSATDIAAGDVEQDIEMKETSPTPADVAEQDTSMAEAGPRRSTGGSSVSEAINQEDLDGGLLDGALDDYDDLDQDTEDTEIGNGGEFSDDDDDDLDDRPLDSSDKLDPDDEMHSPGGLSHADTSRSDDDSEQEDSADQRRKNPGPSHSDDSDSDLPEPEGTDNENDDDDDDDEEDADEDDGDDGDMDADEDEKPKKAPETRKETVMSQKPTLNRPSTITEEELKDSGDELSDLSSEFDDTDDSDEGDDDVPDTKAISKESVTNASSTASASAVGNGRPQAGGRKKSLQDTSKVSNKQEQESLKTEQKDQTEVTNGKARLSERKVSETEDVHHSDKESGSEAHEEEEEEEQAKPTEEDEEEEDLETKQLHKDALEALTSIEVEFATLRDKMYEERMTELDREVEMINAGTHPELSSLMQEIEQKREQRLRFAGMGRKYMIDISQSAYQVAEYRAHCTFQSARRTARTDMIRELGKKQQQILVDLRLSLDTHKRKVIDDKATLVRARKLRRMEANELKNINERLGFPESKKPAPATDTELESDFAAMGHSGGGYYGPHSDVEIYLDGNRCMIDGIWYKTNDSVVVLDAVVGKYNAKYLYQANEEV